MLLDFIKKEAKSFDVFEPDAKKLIVVNVIYAIAFPFIIIFGSAFIMRATGGNNTLTIVYNWGFFIGLVIGYLITGLLLQKKVDIRHVFTAGILLSVLPLCFLMYNKQELGLYVIFYGVLVGTGNGVYWACRNFLSYLVTREENRNFFASIEQFIIIFCNALIPLLFGTFILGHNADHAYKITAYKYTSIVVVATNIVAAIIILKSRFKSPEVKKFLYFKFANVWKNQRILTFCVGMVESGFMVLMTLLILNVAGDETVLGKIEFFTAIVSVIAIYVVGRVSKPEHRGKIMLAGAISLIIGGITIAFTITNTQQVLNFVTISFLGVIIMKISQVVADPMVHSSFRATYLSSVGKATVQENRDSYAYIMDNEYFMNGGRIFGGVVFLLLTKYISDIDALRYTFIILALIQIFSAYLINKLTKIRIDGHREQEIDKRATEKLGEDVDNNPRLAV